MCIIIAKKKGKEFNEQELLDSVKCSAKRNEHGLVEIFLDPLQTQGSYGCDCLHSCARYLIEAYSF